MKGPDGEMVESSAVSVSVIIFVHPAIQVQVKWKAKRNVIQRKLVPNARIAHFYFRSIIVTLPDVLFLFQR